jgi:hypothetical protein
MSRSDPFPELTLSPRGWWGRVRIRTRTLQEAMKSLLPDHLLKTFPMSTVLPISISTSLSFMT